MLHFYSNVLASAMPSSVNGAKYFYQFLDIEKNTPGARESKISADSYFPARDRRKCDSGISRELRLLSEAIFICAVDTPCLSLSIVFNTKNNTGI